MFNILCYKQYVLQLTMTKTGLFQWK